MLSLSSFLPRADADTDSEVCVVVVVVVAGGGKTGKVVSCKLTVVEVGGLAFLVLRVFVAAEMDKSG